MTSRQKETTPSGNTPDSGGLVRKYLGWALFGAFGIGVAVGIALVAGRLASQPVGITGEPVSATASLASPRDTGATRPNGTDGRKKRDARRQEAVSGAGPGTVGNVPSVSSSGSAYSGNPGGSAGSGSSGPSVSGGSGNSSSDSDYDEGEDSGTEHGDDSYEDDDDDYEDDD